MSKEMQIEEIKRDIFAAFGGYEKWEEDWQSLAEAVYNAGYRKQSENMLDIETVKKWLYEMAINNVGCYLEGDFSTACELIISRLDGLKRFAEEMKGGSEPFSRPHENGSEWISVEERLPDNGNAVLVNRYNKSLKFSVANIDNYQGYGKWWDKDYNGEVWTITHWMPLPEAPKMKGGAE